ncbi:MAG: hypothetical protein AB8E15_05470 [Bdellovibrionales bacterium]
MFEDLKEVKNYRTRKTTTYYLEKLLKYSSLPKPIDSWINSPSRLQSPLIKKEELEMELFGKSKKH